jgi:hypothetical protein
LIDAGPITFLTPAAGLVALVGLVPLMMLYTVSEHARGVRAALRLREPADRRLVIAGTVGATAVLVGLAAAQPVLARTHEQRVRADAEAFIVFDTSRSMLASVGPSGLTRLDRAKNDALRLRAALPEVPVGIASMTDRTLPHLFPSADGVAFRSTVEQTISVEQPPPMAYFSTVGTTLAALAALQSRGFFAPSSRRRLLVVFTDGESRPFDEIALGTVLRRNPAIKPVFVHVWNRNERLYTDGAPEPGYRPDPRSGAELERVARATGGASFAEGDAGVVARALRRDLGTGPTVTESQSQNELPLGPIMMALAGLPLVFLLVRLSR